MVWLALALAIGVALGAVVQRGDFCMHSALRGIVSRRPGRMLHVYLVALGLQLLVVNALAESGWIITPFPPVTIVAALVGGLVFGAGMVLAKG